MGIFFLPAFAAGLARTFLQYAVGAGIQRLAQSIFNFFSPPPLTSEAGYVPPFEGGQCATAYYVQFSLKLEDATSYQWTTGNNAFSPDAAPSRGTPIQGAISGFTYVQQSNGFTITLRGGGVPVEFFMANYGQSPENKPKIYRIVRADGAADSCGNPANPNAAPSQDNPIPSNPPPTNGTDYPIQEADRSPFPPPATVGEPLTEGGLPALLANTAAILEALKKLAELLNALADLADKAKKKDPKNKKIVFTAIALVRADGFINLQNYQTDKREILSIQSQVIRRPQYRGYQKGENSPNRYLPPLGSISAVDSFYNIISDSYPISYIRQSIPFPLNGIGIYYHFGLEGKIDSQINLIYSEEE